ncbi:hypothetical protein Avbf_05844 [Armadillidium vulgare]|nr:hypothetical protein Avbf_05844 [Armadillidium vulgare]
MMEDLEEVAVHCNQNQSVH